jgi:hypothetical protein
MIPAGVTESLPIEQEAEQESRQKEIMSQLSGNCEEAAKNDGVFASSTYLIRYHGWT